MMYNTVEMANDYFANNFNSSDDWANIPTTVKTSLLSTAENDILAYLKTQYIGEGVISTSAPYTPFQMAVFEWAMFLYEYKDSIKSNVVERSMGINTVAVDGVGRETKGMTGKRYEDTYNSMIARSPASRFLSMIYKDTRLVR